MPAVLRVVTKGDIVLHPITIAEGLTSMQLKLLQDETVLAGDGTAERCELVAETYKVERGMTRAALIVKMQAAQKTALDELWPQRQKNLPLS